MNWEELPLNARNVIEDVDKIVGRPHNRLVAILDFVISIVFPKVDWKKINTLLDDYDDGDHIFIQKYAETRLASNGINIAAFAIVISLIALMVSIFLSIVSIVLTISNLTQYMTVLIYVAIIGFTCFVVMLTVVFLMYHVLPITDKYEAIIIAIEAAKFDNQKKAKKPRRRVELNEKDTEIICILILFIIIIIQSFIILEHTFP
ncbi:MAG: hypothetical protein KAH86_07975 [Methanosarcinales archaeon]|nr:hypothetical protein [Methanosarcinales archaeon]